MAMIRIFFVFVIAIPVLLTGCNLYPSEKDRTIRPLAEVAEVNRGVSLSELERPSQKPNILWIITDDQRPDSISAYNQAAYSKHNSPLGYIESPNFLKQQGLTVPAEDVEMALYDLKYDPLEKNSVSNNQEYQALANWFRNKLGNIVLGDGRIEADWSQANVYHFSDFAKGADDKKADIPAGLIPD